MYEGCHVPLEIMSDFYGKVMSTPTPVCMNTGTHMQKQQNIIMSVTVLQSSHGHTMKQFMDIFSLPEMTLLSCVNDFFMRHNIDYEPVHLYKDVKVNSLLIILPSFISVLGNYARMTQNHSPFSLM